MGILLTQRSGLIIGNIAKLFGFLMNWIFEALNSIGIESIGLSIILFTVIVYTLLLPLTIDISSGFILEKTKQILLKYFNNVEIESAFLPTFIYSSNIRGSNL